MGGFDINTYFLYVEARENASTAPLALYFAGGPGESSIFTAMDSESGPCYVNLAGNYTVINSWSFNNHVNMLFIDQPVQTGYSYDTLVNGTFNLTDETITPLVFNGSDAAADTDATSWGTWPSQDPAYTTNTTVSSARALWHFGEHWLSSFPEYSTSSENIGFWGNSYGGYWAPETAARFSKNLKTLPAKHPLKANVQQALGAPLNFTESSTLEEAVAGFADVVGTGDGVRQAGLPNLEYLLAEGVKVALIYGDREYRCPWTGAETTAKAANWTGQRGFLSAGYERIQSITGGDQGVVKQYGPLSFSRIFNSGHSATRTPRRRSISSSSARLLARTS